MRKAAPIAMLMLLVGTYACGRSPTSSMHASATELAPTPARAAAALPLKRGYYVASDTPCGKASNATVLLLRRDGIGGSRHFCEFKKIQRTAVTTYRVTEACTELPSGAMPEIRVSIYTLMGDNRFTVRSTDGREFSARYCAQSRMPPEWRANDIRDVTD